MRNGREVLNLTALLVLSSLEGDVHHSTEQAVAFIEQRLIHESNNARPLRGPYLAQLELISRLRHRGCPEEQKLGKGGCRDAGMSLLGLGRQGEMGSGDCSS